MTRAIVVGIDGSAQSRQAMQWAFGEARRSGLPVHLLHAASDGAYSNLNDSLLRDALVDEAHRVVNQAKNHVPADLEKTCTVEWVLGAPAGVLVRASEAAQMVVVGTHGLGIVGAALKGSVSRHVIRYAKCAVVVTHPAQGAGGVVAGLDVDAPEPLLRTAFDQAAARGLPLTVVHAWVTPAVVGAGMGVPATGISLTDIERGEREMAEGQVREWAAKYPDVSVELTVVQGDPRSVLAEASTSGDLLVVGPHGRGWFFGLTLGSTSAAVAEHARSPVMVAR